jgi:hypothetical protein
MKKRLRKFTRRELLRHFKLLQLVARDALEGGIGEQGGNALLAEGTGASGDENRAV